MMAQTVYRSEYKYLINAKSLYMLRSRLAAALRIDKHAGPNGYMIRSLYFDDIDFSSYRDKISGVKERDKYRLRYYNLDGHYIIFEQKSKDSNVSHKTSVRVSTEQAQALMRSDRQTYEQGRQPMLIAFSALSACKLMRPSTIVDYDRIAYTYPVNNVRVTLDMNLRTAAYQYDFFNSSLLTQPVLDDGESILEVKFDGSLPRFISDLLSDVPMMRSSISKYTRCLGIIE